MAIGGGVSTLCSVSRCVSVDSSLDEFLQVVFCVRLVTRCAVFLRSNGGWLWRGRRGQAQGVDLAASNGEAAWCAAGHETAARDGSIHFPLLHRVVQSGTMDLRGGTDSYATLRLAATRPRRLELSDNMGGRWPK